MTDEVVLLKHGRPKVYRICDCCQRYAGAMSARNWCPACEFECTAIGKRLRQKLELMTPAPTPSDEESKCPPSSI
jgi:hypothetical protein